MPESDAPDFLDVVTEIDGNDPEEIWKDYLQSHEHPKPPYSFALCKRGDGFVIACTPRRDGGKEPERSKYNFNMQPLTRLLMVTAHERVEILPDYIFSSRIPTSRELVNFVGGGYKVLHIADMDDARDEHAFEALSLLRTHGILHVKPIGE